MAEAFGGMAISGAILLGVVVLMILVSIAVVKRGEASSHHDDHGGQSH
ncbi:MAG: hypothetical protein HY646_02475 [Acidobacteria bacterium]|nr:hypothetical protein [Acidobacteriota bacterium]